MTRPIKIYLISGILFALFVFFLPGCQSENKDSATAESHIISVTTEAQTSEDPSSGIPTDSTSVVSIEPTTSIPQVTGEETTKGAESMSFTSVYYYIPSREARYQSYAAEQSSLSAEAVVLAVNMDLDYGFYNYIQQVSDPFDLLVLCNKYNQLPSDFSPEDLESVPEGYYVDDGKTYQMAMPALNAFIQMADAAAEEGITLKIASGYRTYAYQEGLYNRYVANHGKAEADTFSARPGHSEHETGLACDINDVSASFEDTDAFRWLSEHAHEYGYILRYPKALEGETGYMYEPWHYRYVGEETATAVFEQNITFDAYYAMMILPKK